MALLWPPEGVVVSGKLRGIKQRWVKVQPEERFHEILLIDLRNGHVVELLPKVRASDLWPNLVVEEPRPGKLSPVRQCGMGPP